MKYQLANGDEKVLTFKLSHEDTDNPGIDVADNDGHSEKVCFIDEDGVLQLNSLCHAEEFEFEVDDGDYILVD